MVETEAWRNLAEAASLKEARHELARRHHLRRGEPLRKSRIARKLRISHHRMIRIGVPVRSLVQLMLGSPRVVQEVDR